MSERRHAPHPPGRGRVHYQMLNCRENALTTATMGNRAATSSEHVRTGPCTHGHTLRTARPTAPSSPSCWGGSVTEALSSRRAVVSRPSGSSAQLGSTSLREAASERQEVILTIKQVRSDRKHTDLTLSLASPCRGHTEDWGPTRREVKRSPPDGGC